MRAFGNVGSTVRIGGTRGMSVVGHSQTDRRTVANCNYIERID